MLRLGVRPNKIGVTLFGSIALGATIEEIQFDLCISLFRQNACVCTIFPKNYANVFLK